MSHRALPSFGYASIGIGLLVVLVWGIWSYASYFGLALLVAFVVGVAALLRAGWIKDQYGDERAAKKWEAIGLLAIICSGLAAIWTFLAASGFSGPLVVR